MPGDRVKRAARAAFLLPTWLLVRVMLPALPRSHPFRDRPPTWASWRDRATPLCEAFGGALWGSGLVALLTTVLYLLGEVRLK